LLIFPPPILGLKTLQGKLREIIFTDSPMFAEVGNGFWQAAPSQNGQ